MDWLRNLLGDSDEEKAAKENTATALGECMAVVKKLQDEVARLQAQLDELISRLAAMQDAKEEEERRRRAIERGLRGPVAERGEGSTDEKP